MTRTHGTFYLGAAVACAALAAGIAYLLTPWVQRAALRYGAAHAPRARDIHQEPVPRWGGVAIYLAFLFALAVSLAVVHLYFGRLVRWPTLLAGFGVFLGGTLSPATIEAIVLPAAELSEYRFLQPDAALTLLRGSLRLRVAGCLRAISAHQTLLLHDGQEV